ILFGLVFGRKRLSVPCDSPPDAMPAINGHLARLATFLLHRALLVELILRGCFGVGALLAQLFQRLLVFAQPGQERVEVWQRLILDYSVRRLRAGRDCDRRSENAADERDSENQAGKLI